MELLGEGRGRPRCCAIFGVDQRGWVGFGSGLFRRPRGMRLWNWVFRKDEVHAVRPYGTGMDVIRALLEASVSVGCVENVRNLLFTFVGLASLITVLQILIR